VVQVQSAQTLLELLAVQVAAGVEVNTFIGGSSSFKGGGGGGGGTVGGAGGSSVGGAGGGTTTAGSAACSKHSVRWRRWRYTLLAVAARQTVAQAAQASSM
jgi:hypothetical protein